VDAQLEQTPVEITEITVVSQTQPLVPARRGDHQTADRRPVRRQLPVDPPATRCCTLQPGVTADNNGNLSIRGGRQQRSGHRTSTACRSRPATAATGSPVRRAPPSASAPTRSKKLRHHGSSSAEFGNAKSGIISVVTKTGGNQYQGSFAYESDEPFGREPFDRVQPAAGQLQRPLAGRLTFALSGTLKGQKSLEEGFNSQDVPIFVQAGVDHHDQAGQAPSTIPRPPTLNEGWARTPRR